MRKAIIASITAAILAIGGPAFADKAVYRQVKGSSIFPSTIVIKCSGWAEDRGAKLTVLEFGGERAVYRCLLPQQV